MEGGFFMPKYDQEFKLMCIHLSDEGKPLPSVTGVQEVALKRYVNNLRLPAREDGRQGAGQLDHGVVLRHHEERDVLRARARIPEFRGVL